MAKKMAVLLGTLLFALTACSDRADEEIDMLFEALKGDQATDSFIELLERVDEQSPYEEALQRTKEEVEKTKNKLLSLDLSTDVANDLRDQYLSSLDDFEMMIAIIESNGPSLSDEDWEELKQISARANEKQMELIREKFERIERE